MTPISRVTSSRRPPARTGVRAWYHNLRAHPDTTIELNGRTIAATGTFVTEGEERDALYKRMVDRVDRFSGYQQRTNRGG